MLGRLGLPALPRAGKAEEAGREARPGYGPAGRQLLGPCLAGPHAVPGRALQQGLAKGGFGRKRRGKDHEVAGGIPAGSLAVRLPDLGQGLGAGRVERLCRDSGFWVLKGSI